MSSNKNVGMILAVIGGSIALLTFFTMPFFSFLGFASVTGQQLASLASQYSQLANTSNPGSNGGQLLIALWAAPVLAGLIILVAALQFRASVQIRSKRVAAGWMIALAILGIALYIGILIYVNTFTSSVSGSPSVFSFLGAGFWIYIIALVGVIVGGAMVLSGRASAQGIAVPPPPFPSPSTQYPPYQPPAESSQWPPSPPNQ